MSPDNEGSGSSRRIQSLVQLCQRVAGNHIESISSLGELPFNLVRPILERCSAEQLLRVEDSSPHLKRDSEGMSPGRFIPAAAQLWKTLCLRTFPALLERHNDDTDAVPNFWRDHFFVLREAEAKRFEEIGLRIRSQRREADERKKEREVKLTDRLPPPKRQRTGCRLAIYSCCHSVGNMPAQPKTLFQKTRSEASKLQKNMYNARMIPPMPKGKDYVPSGRISGGTILSPPHSNYASRVTVNTVIRRPTGSTASSGTSVSLQTEPKKIPSVPESITSAPSKSHPFLSSSNSAQPTSKKDLPPNPQSPPSSPEKLLARPLPVVKKDPMASLFVPKHRAHSQLTR
ncbi:hypothetical protein GYMLUDRAFT_60129 [Collybiopsis luxurians FD-317 M1]|uniref:Elongin-A n=1 Tax=Collybiopsis luxurians FD-317 M1 TaxID=944289 RepID=A0A0D0B7W4_9AGAR|nr:hypothetical protein GYMLUDRAFT_60129 [Collybiopsis luxurians FD-317 M1]